MLEQMTREQFEERWIHRSLNPWTEREAMIAATIWNAVQSAVLAAAGEEMDEKYLAPPQRFMPNSGKPRPKTVPIESDEAEAARMHGGK